MKNEYLVKISYNTLYSSNNVTAMTVEANSKREAATKARLIFETDQRRQTSTILALSATQIEPTPDPINEGDEITVAIPFTGTLHHLNDDIVELVGPEHRYGKFRRRMHKSFLEKLTGRPVAPRPPVVTTEIVSLYPSGAIYVQDKPVKSSSYGVDQLIQVRVTKHDGKIVHKELV